MGGKKATKKFLKKNAQVKRKKGGQGIRPQAMRKKKWQKKDARVSEKDMYRADDQLQQQLLGDVAPEIESGKDLRKVSQEVDLGDEDVGSVGENYQVEVDDGDVGDDGAEVENEMEIGDEFKSDEQVEDELREHMKELEKLKETDPEFYKHLQENDSNLLNFGADDEEEEVPEEDVEPEADDEEVEETQEDDEKNDLPVLDEANIASLQKAVLEGTSHKALQKLLKMFRSACHLGDRESKKMKDKKKKEAIEDDDDHDRVDGEIEIENARVFHQVMHFCFVNLKDIFRKHLGLKDDNLPTHAQMNNKTGKLVKSFYGNATHFVGHIVDPKMCRFVISRLQSMISFLKFFPEISFKIIKPLVNFWSTSDDDDLRLDAFLLMRSLAIESIQDSKTQTSVLDYCIKHMYLGFVRNAKPFNEAQMPQHRFMVTSLTAILAAMPDVSYEHAFVYIRQLAGQLRNVLVNPSSHNKRAICNVQFLGAIRVWTMLLCNCAKDDKSELRALVYPLVQIILEAAEVFPGLRFVPFRLHCIRLLLDLTKECTVYVPIVPLLLKCFSFKELNGGNSGSAKSSKPPNLDLLISAPDGMLTQRGFHDVAVQRILDYSREFFTIHCRSIAFPELSYPVIRALTGLIKGKNIPSQHAKGFKHLCEQLKHHSEWISGHRRKSGLVPKDLDKISSFLQDIDEVSPMELFAKVSKPATAIADSMAASLAKGSLSKTSKKNISVSEADAEMLQDSEQVDDAPMGLEAFEDDIIEEFRLSDDEA